MKFLSTLPARGATVTSCLPMLSQLFLSTLPARGATRKYSSGQTMQRKISIHAPREGSDFLPARTPIRLVIFLSTLPARGATLQGLSGQAAYYISIHAPREGSDPVLQHLGLPNGISIHAPREGSDACAGHLDDGQSLISIHAPREGSDEGTAMRTNPGL